MMRRLGWDAGGAAGAARTPVWRARKAQSPGPPGPSVRASPPLRPPGPPAPPPPPMAHVGHHGAHVAQRVRLALVVSARLALLDVPGGWGAGRVARGLAARVTAAGAPAMEGAGPRTGVGSPGLSELGSRLCARESRTAPGKNGLPVLVGGRLLPGARALSGGGHPAGRPPLTSWWLGPSWQRCPR